MRKALLIAVFITVSLYLCSQTVKNPFEKLGYDVLMATSSKGEFAEFHDITDIVEIGSVLYNTKTKEIVKILDDGETTIDITSSTAAMSIDPLCEKYYWISPYVYCANNPIKFIDPDGRKIILSIKYQGQSQSVKYTYTPQAGLTDARGKSVSIPVNSKAYAIVSAYNDVYKTDKALQNQIEVLVKSDNDHVIVVGGRYDKGKSAVQAGSLDAYTDKAKADSKKGKSQGSTTSYDLSDEAHAGFEERQGIKSTDGSTVAHELRHQYDNETGNMADSVDKSGKNSPAEQRAVDNEDIYRRKKGMDERKTYVK